MMEPFRRYRAPWHRRFTTFCLKGQMAYELQIGRTVFQVPYRGEQRKRWGRIHVWRTAGQ